MPKFSAYMRGEGTKGDAGEIGVVSATAHLSDSPIVSVSTSGSEYRKNISFDFGLVRGEAAGFSTKQNANIQFISVTNNPSVSITSDVTSPNNSKVFNFDFKIPEPLSISKIQQTKVSTTSRGINEITIQYNNLSTTTFTIRNGDQGETGFIEGEVTNVSQLPTTGNHIGRGFLVGQEGGKHLYVYLNNTWTDQGPVLGAGFGQPISSANSVSSNVNPSVSITTDPNSPESAKVFYFDFKIPKGDKGDKGDTPTVTVSSTTNILPVNSTPTVTTSISGQNIHFDFGMPDGFIPQMQANATATDLASGQPASATVSISNNILDFNFGIPQGIIGKDGIGVSTVEFKETNITTGGNIYTMIFSDPDGTTTFGRDFEAPRGPIGFGFYQKIPFTSTNSEQSQDYNWIEETNGTSTLVIDRTENEIIPVSIYNFNNNNIAATFTLAASTQTYPYGTIQYNTEQKFDGILYYIGKAPVPEIGVGSVTTVVDGSVSISTTQSDYKTLFNFALPIKGEDGEQGPPGQSAIVIDEVNVIQLPEDSNPYATTAIDSSGNTDINFYLPAGKTGNGISNITLQSTSGLQDTYKINYTNGTSTTFVVTNGKDGEGGGGIADSVDWSDVTNKPNGFRDDSSIESLELTKESNNDVTSIDFYNQSDSLIGKILGDNSTNSSSVSIGSYFGGNNNTFNIITTSTGEQTYSLSNPTNFRKALGSTTGIWPIELGGTGATTAAQARINLGISDGGDIIYNLDWEDIENNPFTLKNLTARENEAGEGETVAYNALGLTTNLVLKCLKWDASQSTSSMYEPFIVFHDLNGTKVAEFSTFHYRNEVGISMQATKNIGNTQHRNTFTLRLDENGYATYSIANPYSFRESLGASTGIWPIEIGGTGATTASGARMNLGVTDIAIRPDYIISTTDLIDGQSALPAGTLYFYYSV